MFLERASLGLLVGVVACADDTLRLEPVWPRDRAIVALMYDGSGAILTPEPRRFAPGEPIRLEAPLDGPIQVVAYAFAPEVLGDTQVVLGGAGPALPDTEVYQAMITADADSDGFSSLGFGNPFDLRSANVLQARDCEGVVVEPFEVPGEHSVARALILPDGRAFFSTSLEPIVIGELVDDRTAIRYRLSDDPSVTDRSLRLDWDGRWVWLASLRSHVVAIEPDGAVRREQSFGTKAFSFGAGVDGMKVIRLLGQGALELSSTSTAPILLGDFPANIRQIEIVARDEIYVVTTETQRLERRWALGDWRVELPSLGLESLGCEANAHQLIVLGRLDATRQKRYADGNWYSVPRPRDEIIIAGTPVGRAGIAIVAQGHTASIWDGTTWCGLDLPEAYELSDVAAAPDGRTLMFVGEGPQNVAKIYRVQLSAPL